MRHSGRAPVLAKDIRGIRCLAIAMPSGASFDIGELVVEDKAGFPLQPVRPLLLRYNLRDDKEFADVQDHARWMDTLLNQAGSTGRSAPIVRPDAWEHPEAHRLVG